MSKNISACMSKKSVHWATPSKLYQAFLDHGYIDPCPLHADFDGKLVKYRNKKLFINPPFNDLDKWCDYALERYFDGCDIVLLMPSRTDTKYFHKILAFTSNICFIRGRLNFNDVEKKAPFPTILVEMKHLLHASIFSIHRYFGCSVDDYITRIL